ncbi:MAG: hypothetical protein AB7Q92_26545 [Acidimicrobiia bacterium]
MAEEQRLACIETLEQSGGNMLRVPLFTDTPMVGDVRREAESLRARVLVFTDFLAAVWDTALTGLPGALAVNLGEVFQRVSEGTRRTDDDPYALDVTLHYRHRLGGDR